MSPSQFLVRGPISPAIISDLYHNGTQDVGANAIFLGIIRRDNVQGRTVQHIEYSAYGEMAERIFSQIKKQVIAKHEVEEVTILHSQGTVKCGETSMLVYVTSKHRIAAFDTLRETVELIKARAPVWKKEVYEDESYVWVNAGKSLPC